MLMLDARPLGESGARWVNAIPDWMFDESGVSAPTERPELRAKVRRHVMVDPTWTHRVVLEGSPVLFVDMRYLVERVQRAALAAGARASGEEPVRDLLFDGDRVVGVRTARGEHRAPLVVDASGLAGAVRAKVPALRERWPAPKGGDVCSAAQEVRAIADRAGAARWLAEHGAVGDALGVIGLDGGFSTRLVQVHLDRDEVEILTGVIAERGRASGQELVDEFVRENAWVGEKLFGGSGAIPLRRPYDKLAARGVALVGDAGCQVFPAHGSGVGAGMIAAKLLAESLSLGELEGPRAYERAFHRTLGARLAAYDVFRRMSQGLSRDDIATMLSSGLFSEENFSAGLAQKMPDLGPSGLAQIALAAARAPSLAVRLMPAVLRMQAVHLWYQGFSGRRPLHGPWSRAARALVGA